MLSPLSSTISPLVGTMSSNSINTHSSHEPSTPNDHFPGTGNDLVPIGVFWDIENCSVPHGKSPLALVQRIRDRFFTGHKEVEFMCVCDISKENRGVIQELNSGQVTVVHINATSKNAADDKLRQSLRRFANAYQPPATVVLLSGDVNFAAELSDLRHRHKLCVILVHPVHVQRALLATAHQHVSFEELIANLPERMQNTNDGPFELLISNLPRGYDVKRVKTRLNQLADNCGGRVVNVAGTSALIKFPNAEAAARASKRMEGEDVFRNKIHVTLAGSESPATTTTNTAATTKTAASQTAENQSNQKPKDPPAKLDMEVTPEDEETNLVFPMIFRRRDCSKDRKNQKKKKGEGKKKKVPTATLR